MMNKKSSATPVAAVQARLHVEANPPVSIARDFGVSTRVTLTELTK